MTGAVSRARRLFGSIVCGVLAALFLAAPSPAQLPDTMPAPPLRPQIQPPELPAPEPKAEDIPIPLPRPGQEESGESAATSDKPVPMSAEDLACRARLRELGVKFEEHERLSSDSGCLVEHPIAITSLGESIAIEPEAVLNCATARTAAEFVAEIVAPETGARFGSPLVGIRHGSAYVCRTRSGQTKMSEHAFGNAIDFSAFELKDGRVIEAKAHGPAQRDRRDFLRRLRGAACGPFKTVLGPGTDADHADHLHLDLQQRRRGGTWCK